VAALELKFGGPLDRVIARLRALKNHTHIVGSTSLKGRKTRRPSHPVHSQSGLDPAAERMSDAQLATITPVTPDQDAQIIQ
jgi:hypothetical protein